MNRMPGESLVLASASTTRARILVDAGIPITIDPAHLDEAAVKAAFAAERLDAASCARALAETKAVRISLRHADSLVIGADQMLDCGGKWFDKPRDPAEAHTQLKQLRGKRHDLETAVCVAINGAIIWHAADRAGLTMRAFSDVFLDAYIAAAGDTVLSSVGAYRLEGLGAQLFERIEGDYFTILGLPLLPLLHFLRGRGALAA